MNDVLKSFLNEYGPYVVAAIMTAIGGMFKRLQDKMDANTKVTKQTAVVAANLEETLQKMTSIQLERDMYRKILDIIRDSPECKLCNDLVLTLLEAGKAQLDRARVQAHKANEPL